MTMNANRGVNDVPSEEERKGVRQSLQIVVRGTWDEVLVQCNPVRHGFQHDQALKASHAFAQELNRLAEIVAKQQPDDSQAPDYEEKLQGSLRLDMVTSLKVLKRLRKIGAGLRVELSNELEQELKFNGLLVGEDKDKLALAENGPALTFAEVKIAPILWEMMYEGKQESRPDWQKFWGFQVPITHWNELSRNGPIDLRYGLFGAINEDFHFAGREVSLLTQQRSLRLQYTNLAQELQDHVDLALPHQLGLSASQIKHWWASCEPDAWLKSFLAQLAEKTELGEIEADEWKDSALKKIFKKGFGHGLIHFACHCEASGATEFLSRLDMKVAQEPVSLDVSFLATDLRRELHSSRDPGPLVFLNACGTAQQSQSYEPPGFPDKWIKCQGALAVVATICPVPDYFAFAFASKFYEILFEAINSSEPVRNQYVAEALLATRRYFMDEYNNPLGLAYVLYAIKEARIQNDFAPIGVAL